MRTSTATVLRIPSTLALLATLVTGVSLVGCLEASAASPDGAVEGGDHTAGGDTGTGTHPGDGGMKGAPDATVATDGGGGGGKSDAGSSIPICTGATAPEIACNSCVETMCAVDVGPALTACASFYTCYSACACSDMACINACEMAAPMACDTPAENLISCQMSMCATACAVPDGGTMIPDTGAPKDGGPTIPICKDPTPVDTACNDCAESKCSSAASEAVSACGAFYTCYEGCACSDMSCITTCEGKAPKSCDTPAENLISCQKSMCASACTPTDGGTTGEGGMPTASVPDCADPTSAEAMTYAACSACDDAMCAPKVSAAVAACSDYYHCIATTSCADALFVCEAMFTGACATAAGALTTCQDEHCSTACE